MKPAIVWFNHNLSNTWQILQQLRASQRPGEFRLLCSHSDPAYPGRETSDLFIKDRRTLDAEAYVDWCLDLAARQGVELFWPWRQLRALVHARERFAAAGVRLIAAADAGTLELLESKARQYAAIDSGLAAVPEHAVVNTLTGFDAAYSWLRAHGELVCYKPAVSVYGLGFRILAENDALRARLHAGDPYVVLPELARRQLTACEPFPDLLVMPYLQGPERSVDCLAWHGRLLRCVVRRKLEPDRQQQVLEHHAAIEDAVRRLTALFRLHAVFNVQFCDHRANSYLLEINPRMSGGLPAAFASGLIFPLWALRLELGTARERDIPQPQTGIRVSSADGMGSV
jgi:hypothetical protein